MTCFPNDMACLVVLKMSNHEGELWLVLNFDDTRVFQKITGIGIEDNIGITGFTWMI